MEDRKRDHIDLAFGSQLDASLADQRFEYEPMLASHIPQNRNYLFAGKSMKMPLWVSSMTGGTKRAGKINRNLAMACAEFGLGMGLGSCRTLLDNEEHFDDFNVRPLMGTDVPLFGNIGICQLEQLMEKGETDRLGELLNKLDADGLVIHINPLQEAFQPEGDRLRRSPLEILNEYVSGNHDRIIVKEVGQGFGTESLRQLLQLPLEAIEFGALGGTNFSLVELNRSDMFSSEVFNPFIHVGHNAEEMTRNVNRLLREIPQEDVKVKNLIISGGINSVLDGYYLTTMAEMPALFGMGSSLLKHSMEEYDKLKQYLEKIRFGWDLASNFLTVKNT